MQVTLEEFAREVEAMIRVCFEGKTTAAGTEIRLTLPSGKNFALACFEGAEEAPVGD